MSRIYSALNERTNEVVSLYHNEATNKYEVIIKGNKIKGVECPSMDLAYQEYNLALR